MDPRLVYLNPVGGGVFTFATLPSALQMQTEIPLVLAMTSDQNLCVWNGSVWSTVSSSSGGGKGATLAYSPASGSVDPGAGVPGFVASLGSLGTEFLNITLAGNTTFAGFPTGAAGQQLFCTVVSGAYTLTITSGGTTAGQVVLASNNMVFALGDTFLVLNDGTLGKWKLLV